MKAIWDNMRALDVLETLPYVKRSGFGVIRQSLGEHNSIHTAVFDERIRVVHPDVGHNFPRDIREQAYAWVEQFP